MAGRYAASAHPHGVRHVVAHGDGAGATQWGPALYRLHGAARQRRDAPHRARLRGEAHRAYATRRPGDRHSEVRAAAAPAHRRRTIRFDGVDHHHRPVRRRDLSHRCAVHLAVQRARHDRHRHGRSLRAGSVAGSDGGQADHRWPAQVATTAHTGVARTDGGIDWYGTTSAAARVAAHALALRLHFRRFARAPHPARTDPDVLRDADSGPSALGGGAAALTRHYRSGSPALDASRREPAALLTLGAADRPHRARAHRVGTAGAGSARRVCATRATAVPDDLVVPADPGAVRQMLLNLLDNAVKYGPAGQEVRIGATRDNGAARLWVDDGGPGIPGPDRERVWERFWRLERDRGSAIAGSGIGLAVVRELASLHHGRAWIDDPGAGVGTRVVIELPV